MAKYKLTNFDVILTEDGKSIPKVRGNRDYEEYLKWLEGGGIPDEADPIVETPGNGVEERLKAVEETLAKLTSELDQEKIIAAQKKEDIIGEIQK